MANPSFAVSDQIIVDLQNRVLVGPKDFSVQQLQAANLFYSVAYTLQDLQSLNITKEQVYPFFHDGQTYYLLKQPAADISIDHPIFDRKTIFINDVIHIKENEPTGYDPYQTYAFWNFDAVQDYDKINQANAKLLNYLKTFQKKQENAPVRDWQQGMDLHPVWQKPAIPKQRLYYKVVNLSYEGTNRDEFYFGLQINNLTFNIYKNDRLLIYSEDSLSNQLLTDLLKGDVIKKSGYLYQHVYRNQKWVDLDNHDINSYTSEQTDVKYLLLNNIFSVDYLAFELKKNDKVGTAFNKIFNYLQIKPDTAFFEKLIELFDFKSFLTQPVFAIGDLFLERFFTICDIVIGKKIIVAKSIFQGMAYNTKMNLFVFLNKHFNKNNTTFIYAGDDFFDALLLANKIMVLNKGELVALETTTNILAHFVTIDRFLLHSLKYSKTKNAGWIPKEFGMNL